MAFAELVSSELRNMDSQLKTLLATIKTSTEIIDRFKERVTRNQALADLTKEVRELERVKDAVAKLTEQREKSKNVYDSAVEIIILANSEFKNRQQIIYSTIKFDNVFKFLNVEVKTKYNTQDIKDFVEKNLNTRDSEAKSQPEIADLFGENPSEPSEQAIRKIVKALLGGQIKPKVGAGTVAAVLGQLLKNRYMIDYPNSVKTSEGGTYFKDMTGGQKAIAFLELIFSLSNERYPILIDQPEDDLDVGGITNDLVAFITGEKLDRQIIIVSHNANLVVCSDSEQIIPCNVIKTNNVLDFEYVTGAIENPARTADIIKILEGGSDALRKRRLKLGIK